MNNSMQYVVVIEKAQDGSYSAYVPDLPGCVSCGDTLDEVKDLIQEAVGAQDQVSAAYGGFNRHHRAYRRPGLDATGDHPAVDLADLIR